MKLKKETEKISKKNPPITALHNPEEFSGFSKRLIKITKIKIRLRLLKIPKWIKKLVWRRVKI